MRVEREEPHVEVDHCQEQSTPLFARAVNSKDPRAFPNVLLQCDVRCRRLTFLAKRGAKRVQEIIQLPNCNQCMILFKVANGRLLQAQDAKDPSMQVRLDWSIASETYNLFIFPFHPLREI